MAYEDFTVDELRTELARRELDQTGLKADLVSRLEADDAAQAATVEAPAAAAAEGELPEGAVSGEDFVMRGIGQVPGAGAGSAVGIPAGVVPPKIVYEVPPGAGSIYEDPRNRGLELGETSESYMAKIEAAAAEAKAIEASTVTEPAPTPQP